MKPSTKRQWLIALFFLTGLVSLIYEIAWVRQATLTFGVSLYAYSAVLAAYMGGMALGSLGIGRYADRTENPLRLYALLMVGLAVFGFLATFFLQGLVGLYAAWVRSLGSPSETVLIGVRLALAILALTPPAVFIGAAFPLMGRIYAHHSGQTGRDLGWLYTANTLGSVLGCLLTAAVLLRALGLPATVGLASLLTLGIALLAWSLPESLKVASLKSHKGQGGAKAEARPETAASDEAIAPPTKAAGYILWAYAVSGFAALAYEVVWARILSLYSLGAVYSFSIMLTVFLLGLAIGGALSAAWLKRRRAQVIHFGLLEAGIGLLAVLGLFLFDQLASFTLEDIFKEYSVAANMAFEGLLAGFTLLPVTVLIGAVFPVASSLYTLEQSQGIGGRLARLSALNTAGSILGSLLAGFLVVPVLGLRDSLILLAALNLLVGLGAAFLFPPEQVSERSRRDRFSLQRLGLRIATGGIALAALVAAILAPRTQYLGYWENKADLLLFYQEGIETTVAVFASSQDNPKFSTVNGRVEVPTDALSMRAFYLLGYLPAILKPDAQNALMLSFGNGIATGALATHLVLSIEVVELAPEMVEAARQVYSLENRGVVADPRLILHIEDARNFLLQTGRKFDIITTDATHPTNSSSWALFTLEFYQGVQGHLTPSGVFLQWVPIHSLTIADYQAILRTFQHVFPNATLWYTGGSHTLLLATPEPLTDAFLQEKLAANAEHIDTLVDLGQAAQISRHWIMTPPELAAFAGEGRLVRDANAYFLPVNAETQELIQQIQQQAVRGGH